MKKTICVCLFIMISIAYTVVYAQQDEKLTIATYYPAPNAVYTTVRLQNQTAPPDNPKPGMLYYNITADNIFYYNKSNTWTTMMGGGSEGVWHLTPNTTFPGGTPVPGDIFYNNTTDSVVFRNTTGWVRMNVTGHWRESNYKPGSPGHYDIYPVNQSANPLRGIPVNWPATNHRLFDAFRRLSVSNATEEEKIGVFSKYFTDHGTLQELYISCFAAGAFKTYLNATALVSVPDGHLKFAVGDYKRRIGFHAGGYYSEGSEVMNIMNRRNDTFLALPRVCIGSNTTSYQLSVDSNAETDAYASSPFGVRGVQNGVKTGIFNVFPSKNTADWMYGCVYKNAKFYNDPFMRTNGTQNHWYARFVQYNNGSTRWYCGDSITGNTEITNVAASWNKAFNKPLWDRDGVWTGDVSNRDAKENFAPFDRDDILRKINRLEVTRWNYKIQDKSLTHIGPMAEDFYSIFRMGGKDSLSSTDTIGVSLAGIKALIEKSDVQEKQIEELERQLSALHLRLSRR
jgi:hypothetical protein